MWGLMKRRLRQSREEMKDVVRAENEDDSFFKRHELISSGPQLARIDSLSIASVLNLAESKMTESPESWREKVLQAAARPERATQQQRAKWYDSFRGLRRGSSRPSSPAGGRSLLQVLQMREAHAKVIFQGATEKQKELAAQDRLPRLPAERFAGRRHRRISMGDDAMLAHEQLLNIWADAGTHTEDRFRPENNQLGFIMPTANEATADILARNEKERVEELLRKRRRSDGQLFGTAEYRLTRPVGPTMLGDARAHSHRGEDDDEGENPELLSVLSGQLSRAGSFSERGTAATSTSRLVMCYSGASLSKRPLCFTRPLHGKRGARGSTPTGTLLFDSGASPDTSPSTTPTVTPDQKRRNSRTRSSPAPSRNGLARLLSTESTNARRAQTEKFYTNYFTRFTSKQWQTAGLCSTITV